MSSKPTAISLFSGMGGDSLGIQKAGFDIIAFNEFDKAAKSREERNLEMFFNEVKKLSNNPLNPKDPFLLQIIDKVKTEFSPTKIPFYANIYVNSKRHR